jgi:hypothetical protein
LIWQVFSLVLAIAEVGDAKPAASDKRHSPTSVTRWGRWARQLDVRIVPPLFSLLLL